jgi:hypothetical protein
LSVRTVATNVPRTARAASRRHSRALQRRGTTTRVRERYRREEGCSFGRLQGPTRYGPALQETPSPRACANRRFWRVAEISFTRQIACADEPLRLHSQHCGVDRGRASDAPQQGSDPKHEFTFNCRLRVKIGRDSRLECLVVVDVFENVDHGFGAKSVPERIPPGAPFSRLGARSRAPLGIPPVGLELPDRGHHGAPATSRLLPFASKGLGLAASPRSRLSVHSRRAISMGLRPFSVHHRASSPRR